jgi:uncharacterized damage-inducible protein DinB
VSTTATAEQSYTAVAPFLTPEEFLAHWQGHRRLTRRVLEAFPEDQLHTFSIGGMRPFAALAAELLLIGAPLVRGVVTGEWAETDWSAAPPPRDELLRQWDEQTKEIDALFPRIPAQRWHEQIKAFGQYELRGVDHFLYAVDNEIHHRAQGYVYLRALGIEPPAFYDRK